MIDLKTDKQLQIMIEGGEILSSVMKKLLGNVDKGVSLKDLDSLAEREITKKGGKPSFKMVGGYDWSICSCVNEIVVHGVPDDYVIKEEDVVGIDCGVYYKGFHTDCSWTVRVPGGQKNDEIDKFLSVGKKALRQAISKVKVGNYIYDVSKAIQDNIEKYGYSIVKTLIGHGVGRKLHEDPEIPGFVKGKREKTAKITVGMALAVEVIYNMGVPQVDYKGDDGWTIVTRDGKISGLFEATVAVTSHGAIVLTRNYDS